MNLMAEAISTDFLRMPPHSIEAEQALLGSILKLEDAPEDRAAIAKIRQMVNDESFFLAGHSIIYQEIIRLIDAQKIVNVTTVAESLKSKKLFDEIGGYEQLSEILHSVPHPFGALSYAGIVREKSMLRGLIALGSDVLRIAWGPVGDDTPAEISMKFAARFAKLATTGRSHEIYRLDQVASEVYENKGSDKAPRIATGLDDLDRLIGGLRIGGKTIIGAKPGMGKSLLLKQILLNLATRGVKVGVVSIEESKYKIAENMLSNASGVPNNRISFGVLAESEWARLATGLRTLTDIPFFIIDTVRKLSSILAAINILHAEHGCQVIAVDHLHIIDGETNEHREREISKISAELKWVWKDLNVAGIEAAQLNRGSGKDRPSLANLRDSGSLEQDGDVVILLHREDYYRNDAMRDDHVIEAIVAKNKDGATGIVPMHYDGARQSVRHISENQTRNPF